MIHCGKWMGMHKVISGLGSFVLDRDSRFAWLSARGFCNWMSDERYLKRLFRTHMGKELDLKDPRTFNEKLQWLKLHDRRPEYTMMVDKYLVRPYIARQLGEEYLIPLLQVWEDPDAIDFDALPDQFVLKCNHNSGLGMCICEDKAALDFAHVRAELRNGLAQDYYLTGREWPYKDVPRRIIAEQYMGHDISDYKFMCFDGRAECAFVCSERFSKDGLKVTFFDREWNVLPFERHYPKSAVPIPRPENLEKMIAFAEQLSRGIPFVRVDFYEIEGRLYFGELTFYPGSGLEEFTPERADYELGALIKLPNL